MTINKNNVLYAYVRSHDRDYTWKGQRHNQRPAHVAAAARAVWMRKMTVTPEEYLATPGPKPGMLPSLDALHARLIVEYTPRTQGGAGSPAVLGVE